MFGPKPLPHCETLTRAQLKMVHKVLATPFYHVDECAKTIARKGWTNVFIAVARQDRMTVDQLSGQFFFSEMLTAQGTYSNVLVLPHLRDENGDYVAGMLSRVILKLGDDDEEIESLLADISSEKVKKQTLHIFVAHKDERARKLVQLLIKSGADIHDDKGLAMKYALFAQNFDIADDLVKAGFDVSAHAEYIRAYLLQNNADPAALAYLDKLAGQTVVLGSVVTSTDVPPQIEQYLRSGDMVSRSDELPDGGSLTTVFNFATRQQIVIVHVAGQTASPVVTPFSQIEGRGGLRAAAAAFAAQGGTADGLDALISESSSLPLLSGPAKPVAKITPDSR